MSWIDLQPAQERTDLFRELIVLLLDGSESMSTIEPGAQASRFDEMSAALDGLLTVGLPSVPELRSIGEVAVGVFAAGKVTWLDLSGAGAGVRFHPISRLNWNRSALGRPAGNTPLAAAIIEAADVLAERVTELRESPLSPTTKHRPIILTVTDGRPTDPSERLVRAAELLAERAFRARSPEFLFAALGVRGADEDVLRDLAPDSTFMLGTRPMGEVVEAMLKTITALTAQGGNDSSDERGTTRGRLAPEYATMRIVMQGYADYQ